MTPDPEDRLAEAIKQVSIAREDVRRPDRDSALAKAEYLLRGVRDELEENDDRGGDGIDPSLVTDGGRDQHLTVQVRGKEKVSIVQNALEAAARDSDAELNSSAGRPGDGEITKSEALVEVARAYTGWRIDQGEEYQSR